MWCQSRWLQRWALKSSLDSLWCLHAWRLICLLGHTHMWLIHVDWASWQHGKSQGKLSKGDRGDKQRPHHHLWSGQDVTWHHQCIPLVTNHKPAQTPRKGKSFPPYWGVATFWKNCFEKIYADTLSESRPWLPTTQALGHPMDPPPLHYTVLVEVICQTDTLP